MKRSMMKFGIPIGAGPKPARLKVGLAAVGTPSGWRIWSSTRFSSSRFSAAVCLSSFSAWPWPLPPLPPPPAVASSESPSSLPLSVPSVVWRGGRARRCDRGGRNRRGASASAWEVDGPAAARKVTPPLLPPPGRLMLPPPGRSVPPSPSRSGSPPSQVADDSGLRRDCAQANDKYGDRVCDNCQRLP